MTVCTAKSARARELLNGSPRYYQNLFYIPLLIFGLVCLVHEPSSPVSRFMPQWLHGTYLVIQVVAPSMSFGGQIIQKRHPNDAEIVANGWLFQLGADICISCLLFVATYAFAIADDEPSKMFILPVGVLLVGGAVSLVVRDALFVIGGIVERRLHGAT